MVRIGLKQRLARALVRTTTVERAYPRAEWRCVLESEAIDLDQAAAPPFAPEARYLSAPSYSTPRVMTGLIRGALYYSYLNVLLAPLRAVLLDTDNTYLETGYAIRDKIYWRHLYRPPIEEISGASFILRSPVNNFYHTLIDNLPRLYVLHDPSYEGLPISLLVPGPLLGVEEHFLRRLLPSNVEIKKVQGAKLYRLESAIFGSYMSRQMCGYLPRAYRHFFLERTLPRRPRRKCNRIYVSRRKAPTGRRILNEDEVLRVVEGFGFQSVVLEDLPLDAQIDLFFDADAVIAGHGAGLTNLLFSDRARVLELHPTQMTFPHYYFLCQAMGHPYRFICSSASTRHSDFLVDIPSLVTNLRHLLN